MFSQYYITNGNIKFEFATQEELDNFRENYFGTRYFLPHSRERRIAGSKRVERYRKEHGCDKDSGQGLLLQSITAHPALSTRSFEVCFKFMVSLYSVQARYLFSSSGTQSRMLCPIARRPRENPCICGRCDNAWGSNSTTFQCVLWRNWWCLPQWNRYDWFILWYSMYVISSANCNNIIHFDVSSSKPSCICAVLSIQPLIWPQSPAGPSMTWSCMGE